MDTFLNITSVTVVEQFSAFNQPFQFNIQYTCLADLRDDLEWQIVYNYSGDRSDDIELENVLVGPIRAGSYQFILQSSPLDSNSLPDDPKDVLGSAVVLVTCSYQNKEFISVGFFVNTEYESQDLKDNPPEDNILFDKLVRQVLIDKPVVKRVRIDLDESTDSIQLTHPEENADTILNAIAAAQ